MQIPADLPCPDQENVYYSVNALVQELSNFFEPSFIKNIRQKLSEYTMPAFVINTDDAPNSYQIDVYPRGGTKFNVLLDSNGAFSVVNESKNPQVTSPEGKDLQDGGSNVELDPTFYANTKLKSKDFFTELTPDPEATPGIDTVLASKFWLDEGLMKERGQYLDFIRSLVKDSLETLPEEEFDILKANFEKKEEEINGVLSVLTDIRDGEQASVGSLYPDKLLRSYPQSSNSLNKLEITKQQFAQSFSDLNNAVGSTKYYRKGQLNVGSVSNSINTTTSGSNSFERYRRVWNNFIKVLIDNGLVEENKISSLTSGPIIDAGPELNSILNFSDNGVEKETFAKDGWISEWYFDNFAKILKGDDLDFSSMKNFLDTYDSTLKKVQQTAKLGVTGGNFLLVSQAIKKAILNLCQSNLDVTNYAPMMGDTDMFTQMGRSGVLGPSGCHQAPSRYVTPEDEYTIDNFTKTGFLCYHALLKLIDNCWKYSRTRTFILDNIEKFDSDHDKVINMWDDISETGLASKQTVGLKARVANGAWVLDRVAEQDKRVAHLYRKNESWTGNKIYLIPAGDDKTGKSERTFIGYNLRGIDHTTEHSYTKRENMYLSEGYGLKPLADDSSSAVDSYGNLSISNIPTAYKRMGYVNNARMSSISAQSSSFSRNHRVHYGIYNPSAWDSSNRSNNTYDFWRQKNYNLPYFWCSTMSLFKGITIEVYRNLLASVNEILDVDIELSDDEITTMFDNSRLWYAINNLVDIILSGTGIRHNCFVRVDGTIGFTDDVSGTDLSRMWQTEYRNTSGDNNGTMLRNYAKFASSVSGHNSIKFVDLHEEIEFDYATYLPPEGLSIPANKNFKNTHGGGGAYISDQFSTYFDPLEFREIEFLDARPINKSKNALGTDTTFLELYTSFIETSKEMFQHSIFHKEIRQAFANMQKFIEGFSVSDEIVSVFTEGGMDIKTDIQNPSLLISQISSNRKRFGPDPSGIGQRWNDLFLKDTQSFVDKSKDWIYCYVIGIKKSAFDEGGGVAIQPEYIGSDNIVEFPELRKQFSLVPNDASDELESADILRYFHLVRGLDISEITFSSKTELIFEQNIIDSESGVFPWIADDFEEGKPKEKMDNAFAISPLVHPTNYFYDVCIQNEYARVVGVVLKASDFENYLDEVDSIDQNNVIRELIGSIRWVIPENST